MTKSLSRIIESFPFRKPSIKPFATLERRGSFHFLVPVNTEISCGDYVLLSSLDHTFLGHVDMTSFDFFHERQKYGFSVLGISQEMVRMVSTGYYTGSGQILAEIRDSEANLEFDRYSCVGNASIRPASFDAIESYLTAAYSNKDPLFCIGTVLNVKDPLRAKLIADGFKRHTGLFGQSGSGKSFALAVLLEELYLNTAANIVVLDLNGDFTRFKELFRSAKEINHRTSKYVIEQDEIERYKELHLRKNGSTKILSVNPSGNVEPLVIRFSDLDARQQSLLFKLDPIKDKEEYLILSENVQSLSEDKECYGIGDLGEFIKSRYSHLFPEAEWGRYAGFLARIENLTLEQLRIWSNSEKDGTPLVTLLNQEGLQTIIIDLSDLSREERSIVSAIVFGNLWNKQIKRKQDNVEKPCFLLIDEAHNLFPVTPLFPDQELTLDWGIRIAGEGRKFGLYLLISSQLPSKIHEHVLTQCGNVILMKMPSQCDVDTLRNAFSFVSETFLQMPNSFQVGEALVIGGIVPSPCLVHFEGRKTQEGGKDFKVKWT